jgi:hypothetical protein
MVRSGQLQEHNKKACAYVMAEAFGLEEKVTHHLYRI